MTAPIQAQCKHPEISTPIIENIGPILKAINSKNTFLPFFSEVCVTFHPFYALFSSSRPYFHRNGRLLHILRSVVIDGGLPSSHV